VPAPDAPPLWVCRTDHAAWSARDSAGAVVHDGRMWLLGGYTPARVNDVWRSADGVTWECVTPSAPWEGRNLPCAVTHDGRMWVMGGVGATRCYNDVWCSADGAQWQLVAAAAPWSPRCAASAVAHQGRMWVLGGMDLDGFAHHNDVWCSEDGCTWELVVGDAPWSPRAMHASVVFGDRIWVLGGGIYNTGYELNTVVDHSDVWCSDDGSHWTLVTAAAAWPARRFHGAAVCEGALWVIGGFALGNRNDVWWSEDGLEWQEAQADAVWAPRHAPACLVFGDVLRVIGGSGARLFDDVWTLQSPYAKPPSSDAGAPAARERARPMARGHAGGPQQQRREREAPRCRR